MRCGETIRRGNQYCAGCGASACSPGRATQPLRGVSTSVAHRRRKASFGRDKRKRYAARVMLALAMLFVLEGVITGFQSLKETEQTRVLLDLAYEGTDLLEHEGKAISVTDLRRILNLEVTMSFAIPIAVAVVFLGLASWARASPLPASILALCIYLAIVVLAALHDPSSLFRGLLWKFVFVAFLAGGIQAAVGDRAAQQKMVLERARRRAAPARA